MPVRTLTLRELNRATLARQRRVIADEHRAAVDPGGEVTATFLVDGFVAGSGRSTGSRVRLEPAPLHSRCAARTGRGGFPIGGVRPRSRELPLSWLDPGELRVGLGCMRLSTDADRDEERALATIVAAVEAGITVFDTARAYGDNEQLLARALRSADATTARIVTKGGMTRPGGAWVPDGRARSIRADCEASLEALDGLPIDAYLLHAPDPRTPWRTSVRTLAKLVDEGLVARIGVCNVNRAQLDEALELAPISVVQVALSILDDTALRGGVVERCADAGITLIAHSPLGGPRRVGRLAREKPLAAIAHERGVSPAELALAWLLDLAPNIVAIPGARRPETARSSARARVRCASTSTNAHGSVEPAARARSAAPARVTSSS